MCSTRYFFHEPCLTCTRILWCLVFGMSLPLMWQCPFGQALVSLKFHSVVTVTTSEYVGA